jgi:hypothetical protein
MSHLGGSSAEIKAGIADLLDPINYGIKLNDVTKNYDDLSLGRKLSFIIRRLAIQSKKQVVVIIDEYDAPVLRLMDQPDQQKKVIAQLDDFYGILKSLGEHLRLVYITGTLAFSFLSLNNLTDHTFSTKASAICGYTEEEVEQNYQRHLELLAQTSKMGSTKEALSSLKEMSNRYCFGLATGLVDSPPAQVFNPFAINNALNDLDRTPDRWLDLGYSEKIVELLLESRAAEKLLDEVQVPLFDLVRRQTADAISLERLMYSTGYSTIRKYDKETGMVTLAPPSEHIRRRLRETLAEKRRNVGVRW